MSMISLRLEVYSGFNDIMHKMTNEGKEVKDLAGKKKDGKQKKGFGKSIIKRLMSRLEFADIKIMSFVLTVVVLVCIIAATVAWWTFSDTVGISGLSMTSSSTESVEISLSKDEWVNILEPGSIDVSSGLHVETQEKIDISMPAFENIYDTQGNPVTQVNSGIVAPGVYGSFTFYAKSINTYFKKCQVNISKVLDVVVEDDENLTDEVNQLFSGHILSYAVVDDDDSNYIYVSDKEFLPLEFQFQDGESDIRKVTVYWVWPYEYKDVAGITTTIGDITIGDEENPVELFDVPEPLPDELSMSLGNEKADGYKLSPNQLFEWKRYEQTISRYKESDEATKAELLSDWYDYGDTLLGTYVENMMFHITVRGVPTGEE